MALPASLETPSPLCPALGPRADLHALPNRRFDVAPARSNTKAPPFTIFRDSMTRLHGSLPTLEDGISARVAVVEPTGLDTMLVVRRGDDEMVAMFRERHEFTPGQTVHLRPRAEHAHLFDTESGKSI